MCALNGVQAPPHPVRHRDTVYRTVSRSSSAHSFSAGPSLTGSPMAARACSYQAGGTTYPWVLLLRTNHERGYACLMCSIHGADRLRQDVDDRTGLVCETCPDLYDLTKTAFINA